MSSSESPSTVESSARRRTHRSRSRQTVARLWSEWRVEILIVLMLATGVFLVAEHVPIRKTVQGWLQNGVTSVQHIGRGILQLALDFVERSSLSDLVGYAILAAAVVFVGWRIRWRLMTAARFRARECPRCGSGLHRIHRHFLDRAINLFLPVRRYRCRNRECGWQGLRIGRQPLE